MCDVFTDGTLFIPYFIPTVVSSSLSSVIIQSEQWLKLFRIARNFWYYLPYVLSNFNIECIQTCWESTKEDNDFRGALSQFLLQERHDEMDPVLHLFTQYHHSFLHFVLCAV